MGASRPFWFRQLRWKSRNDYDGAIKKYKELLEKYPRSELRAEVESHIAFCINRRRPIPEYTESETDDARNRINIAREEAGLENDDLDKAALDENEKMLIERMAQKRFDQAMFYKINGHYRAAEVYFEVQTGRKKFPKTKWAGRPSPNWKTCASADPTTAFGRGCLSRRIQNSEFRIQNSEDSVSQLRILNLNSNSEF